MSVVQFDVADDGRFGQTMAGPLDGPAVPSRDGARCIQEEMDRDQTGREGPASPSFPTRYPPQMDTAGRTTRPREFGVEDVRVEPFKGTAP